MAPQDAPIWFKTFMNDDARHPNDLGHKFLADIAVWSIQQVQSLACCGLILLACAAAAAADVCRGIALGPAARVQPSWGIGKRCCEVMLP
jgi:hypothetical protein